MPAPKSRLPPFPEISSRYYYQEHTYARYLGLFHQLFVTSDNSYLGLDFERAEIITRREHRYSYMIKEKREYGREWAISLKTGRWFYWWDVSVWEKRQEKNIWLCEDESLETILEKAELGFPWHFYVNDSICGLKRIRPCQLKGRALRWFVG